MSEAAHTPRLRFPEFSGEWENEVVGNISNKVTDGTHDTPKPSSTGVPYITAIHVKDGVIDFDRCYYLSIEEHKKIYSRCNPEKNDILMVNIGAGTATTALINIDYEFSLKNVALIKPNKLKSSSKFLVQSLRYKSGRLHHQLTSGGAQPFLSLKEIKRIKLNLPTKPEQQKIADFLTAVDNKIEQLSKKQALLSEYKKGLMQQIFSQAIRFKADDGIEFPDWEEKKLGGVGRIRKGSQLNKSELTDTGDYPAINGGINPSGYTDKWNTGKNTITISEGGNSCGYINFITSKFWSGGHCYSIEELKGDVLNRFLFQYLKFNEHLIMRLRVGSGLPNIQKGEINNFKVNLPSLEEQTKIANLLSSIDSKIEQVGKQLRESKQFKKALLQQMFV
jgi:type I restriction enzyme S subunit